MDLATHAEHIGPVLSGAGLFRGGFAPMKGIDDHVPRKMAYHAEQGRLAEMQGKESARKRRIKSVVQSWKCISFERVFVSF